MLYGFLGEISPPKVLIVNISSANSWCTFMYLRIELYFFRFHWEIKCHGSRVNLVKREAFLKKDYATVVGEMAPPSSRKSKIAELSSHDTFAS